MSRRSARLEVIGETPDGPPPRYGVACTTVEGDPCWLLWRNHAPYPKSQAVMTLDPRSGRWQRKHLAHADLVDWRVEPLPANLRYVALAYDEGDDALALLAEITRAAS